MIWLILGGLSFILFLIITLPVLGVLFIVRCFNPVVSARVAQAIVKYAFRFVLFMAGTRTKRIGIENIPKDTPVMFAANHRGLLDAGLAYGSLPVLTGTVAKAEIKKAPVFSLWMILVQCYFLDRKDMRSGMKMILNSIDLINKGTSVFIAPEGTRSKTEGMNPFKEGSFKIATKTGCPIVPVAISGADDALENTVPFLKRNVTVIEYGKPIYLDKLTDEEKKFVGAYTQKIVAEMLEGHKEYIKNNPSFRKRKMTEKTEENQ